MDNFQSITASPEALAAFLGSIVGAVFAQTFCNSRGGGDY